MTEVFWEVLKVFRSIFLGSKIWRELFGPPQTSHFHFLCVISFNPLWKNFTKGSEIQHGISFFFFLRLIFGRCNFSLVGGGWGGGDFLPSFDLHPDFNCGVTALPAPSHSLLFKNATVHLTSSEDSAVFVACMQQSTS